MAFKKGHVWSKEQGKYVPAAVIKPNLSFDPVEKIEPKTLIENPIDKIIEDINVTKKIENEISANIAEDENKELEDEVITEIKQPVVINEPEVVKEKLQLKKEMLNKIADSNNIFELIEAFWFEYNSILKNKLANYYNMNIPTIYWLVWSITFNKVLFEKLKKMDENIVLNMLLSLNEK